MRLRRTLIVVGGGFMTAAGLAVVVAMMTVPRWVLTVVMTSPRDMLQRRVTVDEAIGAVTAATVCLKKTVAETESARTVQNERPSSPLFANDRWRAFLAQMQEGDELWTFCTPPETWEHVAGFDVLIRTERHPACRQREARPGSCTERENLAGDAKGKAQATPTVRLKVPMRRRGADCLVVATKWGNADGAKGVGHRR